MSTEAHKRLAAQLQKAEEIIGTLDLHQVSEAHVKIIAGQAHPEITVRLVGRVPVQNTLTWVGEQGPELHQLPGGTQVQSVDQNTEKE